MYLSMYLSMRPMRPSIHISKPTLIILLGLLLQSCQMIGYSSSSNQIQQQYQHAIDDAAVIEADEVSPLPPVVGDTGLFVTWTAYPDSFPVDKVVSLNWGDTWVTMDGAVQQQCTQFDDQHVNLRIQQLLGLPPVPDAKRFFVVLQVATDDMFRPCANPDLMSTFCDANFSDDSSEAHRAWYAGQTALAYQSPNGYPWTRLGYTYNWNPAANEVGVAELVIRQGASAKVMSVTSTQDYCR